MYPIPEPPAIADALRPDERRGLLSFTLMQTLGQRQSPLTYRELYQAVTAQYRSARGARGPVPFAEGDLEREVLGYNVWPARGEMLLTGGDSALTINAGELRGVTRGSSRMSPASLGPKAWCCSYSHSRSTPNGRTSSSSSSRR